LYSFGLAELRLCKSQGLQNLFCEMPSPRPKLRFWAAWGKKIKKK